MNETTITAGQAWLPFTPRGVAAFAAAPLRRLLLVELVVAAFSAAIPAWFIHANWFSVVREAVARLPEGAAIRHGLLQWPTNTPVRLAENPWLGLVVDAKGVGGQGRTADVEVTLQEKQIKVASLLGFIRLSYPQGRSISLSRADVIPWWGAWETPILAMFMAAEIALLMAIWLTLATFYTPLALAFGFYANRRLGWRSGWKLCGAALMPGALVAVAGVFCYGWLGMDLLRLGMFFLLHFLAGWIYLAASPYFLPRDPRAPMPLANPFAPPTDDKTASPKPEPENPFAGPSPDLEE